MSLPIRTTLDDIKAVCGYLATKPTGASLAETKAVVDPKRLDSRKLTAFKFWGLIEDNGAKFKITDRGRDCVKEAGSKRFEALRQVVLQTPAYQAIIERVVHRSEQSISATDVSAHWHEHFQDDVSDSDKMLNDQAVCFFQIAQGSDFGSLVIGRKGKPTRFDFNMDIVSAFVNDQSNVEESGTSGISEPESTSESPVTQIDIENTHLKPINGNNRVFITHGKNQEILDQVKEIVSYGKFEPVVAEETETAAKPVPIKVMEEMRDCKAAVLHVSAEGILYDKEGKEIPQINQNVLIEIGAAMALYGEKFVLLVEDGVILPSNLQGLYECRYQGDELNMTATMKLLKAFNEF